MCEHGTSVDVANLPTFNGEWYERSWTIDACIADLVVALTRSGVPTVGSCCGHGSTPGSILLKDGRTLVVSSLSHDEGIEAACQVAKQRIGTRRSRTVNEIVNAYVGVGFYTQPEGDER